mmetsp:Transcript_16182/g.52349  ORF Transcript_16182/g.52349 Transcript_16182/m.52349 type:complete len:308 (-) Transcript_16182:378-1301(-)
MATRSRPRRSRSTAPPTASRWRSCSWASWRRGTRGGRARARPERRGEVLTRRGVARRSTNGRRGTQTPKKSNAKKLTRAAPDGRRRRGGESGGPRQSLRRHLPQLASDGERSSRGGEPCQVEQQQHQHAGAERGEGDAAEAGALERRVAGLVECVVDREGDEEVDAVEGRAEGVRHVPVLKVVVRKVRDRERLHEGGGVREGADHVREQSGAQVAGRKAGRDAPQRQVGEDMVGGKVKVGGEVHADGHVIQPPRGHRVARAQHAVKVVRVPVVADEAKDRDPKLRARTVPFAQRPPVRASSRQLAQH